MLKKLKIISIFLLSILFGTGCSQNYHNEMMTRAKKSVNKKSLINIKESYSQSLVNEKTNKRDYIDISNEKSLSAVLKELELIDGNFYFLKSSDLLIPKSRMKIHNMSELNQYLNAVLDKELFIKKSGSIYLVKLLSKSEAKRQSIDRIAFKLDGEISVEELIKLITSESGYEISIGSYIEDAQKFQDSIISVNTKNLIDAIEAIANSKNV